MFEVIRAQRKFRYDQIYVPILKFKLSKELDQIRFGNCFLPISYILKSNMQLLRVSCGHLSNSNDHLLLLIFAQQSKISNYFSQLLDEGFTWKDILRIYSFFFKTVF